MELPELPVPIIVTIRFTSFYVFDYMLYYIVAQGLL